MWDPTSELLTSVCRFSRLIKCILTGTVSDSMKILWPRGFRQLVIGEIDPVISRDE